MEKLNEKAKSKTQRRLFAMALAYKNGELSASDLSKYGEKIKESVKKLSKISEDTLHQYASTKQLKRRKDGSVGKRNAIPERVKK